MDKSKFRIDAAKVPIIDKDDQRLDEVDEIAAKKGYANRDPRRGRKRSPRTEQIHTWVRPHVKEGLLAEAERRGVHQGRILEEAWELYQKQNPDSHNQIIPDY